MLKDRRSRLFRDLRRCALLAALGAAISTQSVHSADITVSTNADSGAGSLREALTNAQSGDRIVFDFPADTTITIASDLPSIDGDLSFTTSDPVNNPIAVTIDLATSNGLSIDSGTIDPTGLIVINGSGGPHIDVASGATIIGDGTVTGNILLPGTLSPGTDANIGTIGTFDVVGDLDLSGGQLQVDLEASSGSTSSDLVTVSGDATVTGASLSFRFSGDEFQTGQQFLILDAGTALSTTFSNQSDTFAIPDRPFLELAVDTSGAFTANQLGFARPIRIRPSTPWPAAFSGSGRDLKASCELPSRGFVT